MIFVPAQAADRKGNRLGRGAGYYDRFLTSYPHIPTVCVLPDFAFFSSLPVEKTDQKVDKVIVINSNFRK